ncbi:MAG: D-lactate dehydrogenase [Cardiobacteriaceae bacterium]|nr:D-lactate dehydrogenase [Cardiobacteriaceae bacterium]
MNSWQTRIAAIVGDNHLLLDPEHIRPYAHGFRYGKTLSDAVVVPQTLVQAWQVAKICAEEDLILIPQASNTGITGGSTPEGDYERPVILLALRALTGIHLLDHGKQAVALPGATLFQLEDLLRPLQREPHSVIGSSCIGASVIGGICNNSGGALVQRGPAYTEMALFARRNEQGELELVNHLGIDLGDSPEDILDNLENGRFAHVHPSHGKRCSASDYEAIVRDIDAPTPARHNNDPARLHEASGSAGKNLVFAVRIDTFEKPAREQVFYIGTNHTAHLTAIRRHILAEFPQLPVSGEYLHRDLYDIAHRYGRDTFLIIRKLGTHRVPAFFRLKSRIDRLARRIGLLPNNLADRLAQTATDLLPSHLPKAFHALRERYEHHLILKMADDNIERTRAYLDQFFRNNEGSYHACTPDEGEAAILHRFAAAGSAARYHSIMGDKVGELMSLDIALPRNESEWFERLPPALDAKIHKKLYCGHFFCHVMHQDYILEPGVDPAEIKAALLAWFDSRGAKYPAEHNVGHLYHASPELAAFYREQDPQNRFNPGIGKTSRKKHWV